MARSAFVNGTVSTRFFSRLFLTFTVVLVTLLAVSSSVLAQGKGGGKGGSGGGGGGGESVSDPIDLVNVDRTTSEIQLSWTSAGGPTAGFIVAYEKDGIPRRKCRSGVQIDVGNVESFTISGLDYDSLYGIRVCAYDASGGRSDGVVVSESTLPIVSMAMIDDIGGQALFLDIDIQMDGKFVVGAKGAGDVPTLLRYDSEGSRDTTFSDDGMFRGEGMFGNFRVAALSNGQIVAATGHEEVEGGLGIIAFLLNDDGSIEAETVILAGNYERAGARDILELPNGQLLFLTHVNVDGFFSVRLIRLNADMSLDATFGDNGVVSHTYPLSTEVHRFVLDDDGYAVVAGNCGWTNGFAARYDVLDGSEVYAKLVPGVDHVLFGVCLDSQGNAFFGGRTDPIVGADGDGAQTEVIKLDRNGNFDLAWANNGVFQCNFSPGDEEGPYIAVDSQDRLYIAGTENRSGRQNDVLVSRLKADGSLDTGWANNGSFYFESAVNDSDQPSGITIDAFDRPVIVGSTGVNYWSESVLILRLNK